MDPLAGHRAGTASGVGTAPGTEGEASTHGTAGEGEERRRRRLTARLQEVFNVRTRRQGDNAPTSTGAGNAGEAERGV
jgi:hypothetical protein